MRVLRGLLLFLGLLGGCCSAEDLRGVYVGEVQESRAFIGILADDVKTVFLASDAPARRPTIDLLLEGGPASVEGMEAQNAAGALVLAYKEHGRVEGALRLEDGRAYRFTAEESFDQGGVYQGQAMDGELVFPTLQILLPDGQTRGGCYCNECNKRCPNGEGRYVDFGMCC